MFKSKKGFSLVEVLIASCVLGIVVLGVSVFQVTNYKGVQKAKDKTFATQKAMQMLDEMRKLVDGGNESDVLLLDDKDDNNKPNFVLTTEAFDEMVTVNEKAGNSISGNVSVSGKWKFARKIKIERRSDDERARNVYVSVYYADPKDSEKVIEPPIAYLTALLKTNAEKNLPSQVYDTYLLAPDNMSGWWSDPQLMKPVYQDVVSQIKAVNPGLDLRLHEITNLCYGKDPFYAPYSTYKFTTNDSTHPIKYPYFYPGTITNQLHSDQQEEYFGVKNLYNNGARLRVDQNRLEVDDMLVNAWYSEQSKGDEVGITNDFNNKVFSVADMYSHGLRWPEEINNYNRLNRYTQKQARSDSFRIKDDRSIDLEPTYRILLEKMRSTNEYKNAMVMDLLGETFPVLPIRNYSDPAKYPITDGTTNISNNMNKRVVTHPENIEYRPMGPTEKPVYGAGKVPPIKLRVYPYVTQEKVANATGQYDIIERISVFLPMDGKVGAKASSTEIREDEKIGTLKNFAKVNEFITTSPDFLGIPEKYNVSKDVIEKIKEKLAVTYINAGVSSYPGLSTNTTTGTSTSPDRISGNLVGNIRLVFPSATTTNPVFVRAGTVFNFSLTAQTTLSDALTNPQRNIKMRVTKDIKITSNTTGTTAANLLSNPRIPISSIDNYPSDTLTSYPNVSSFAVDPEYNYIHNNSYSVVSLSPISIPSTLLNLSSYANIERTTAYDAGQSTASKEGLFTVEVNPIFDRDGDGKKSVNSGVLISLYNTRSRHNYISSTGKNLSNSKRLYGLEYIPTPLGNDMPNIGSVAVKYGSGDPVNTSTYNNITRPISGGSKSTTVVNGYESFWGRDLDDNLNNLGGFNGDNSTGTFNNSGNYAKNTAKWIISVDVNGSTEKNNSDYNPFAHFRGAVMPVETRIGKNLNSGMTVNQTINAVDGTVVDLLRTDSNPYEIPTYSTSPTESSSSNLTWRLYKQNIDANDYPEDKLNALKSLPNLSRTYVWINENPIGSILPHTERYQFMGDPRHNPYLDVLQNRGFNIHFSAISTNTTTLSNVDNRINDYPCFLPNSLYDYENKKSDVDIFRAMQVFRESMASSSAIWNSLTGYSSWMYSVGGDIVTNGTAFNDQNFTILNNSTSGPYDSGIGTTGQIMDGQTFSDASSKSLKVIGKTDSNWVSIPWLGELYPDEQFFNTTDNYANTGSITTWLSDGNLSGTSYKRYNINSKTFKYVDSSTSTTAVKLYDKGGRLLDNRGCTLFFNESNNNTRDNNTFRHYTDVETHSLTTNAGVNAMSQSYNINMQPNFLVTRAFDLNTNPGVANGWYDEVTRDIGTNISLLDGNFGSFLNDGILIKETDRSNHSFYDISTTKIGSSLIRVELPYMTVNSDQSNRFYVLMNGLASSSGGSAAGKAPVIKLSAVGVLHSYLSLGDIKHKSALNTTNEEVRTRFSRMPQVPLVQFTSSDHPIENLKGETPKEGIEVDGNNVSNINLDWITSWQKWSATYDNFSKYTWYYPDEDAPDPAPVGKRVNTWKENGVTVVYQLMYSANRGKTWFYLKKDGSSTTNIISSNIEAFPGRYVGNEVSNPSNYVITCDTNCYSSDSTNFNPISANTPGKKIRRNWDISGLSGSILFRVEAYRRLDTDNPATVRTQHYSYHQREMLIRK